MARLFYCFILLLLAGCGGRPELPSLPAGSVVLAFGDSVTAGVGAGPGEDYPSQLEALSAWRVHNAGVSGDTAEDARSRIDAAIAAVTPQLVIIEIGGNDFLQRRPQAQVKEHIRELINKAQASGARVVLVAVPAFSVFGAASGQLQDAPLYAELAREEQVVLVEEVFAEVLSDPSLRADPIHPNRNGYARLSAGLVEVLQRRGVLRTPK